VEKKGREGGVSYIRRGLTWGLTYIPLGEGEVSRKKGPALKRGWQTGRGGESIRSTPDAKGGEKPSTDEAACSCSAPTWEEGGRHRSPPKKHGELQGATGKKRGAFGLPEKRTNPGRGRQSEERKISEKGRGSTTQQSETSLHPQLKKHFKRRVNLSNFSGKKSFLHKARGEEKDGNSAREPSTRPAFF